MLQSLLIILPFMCLKTNTLRDDQFLYEANSNALYQCPLINSSQIGIIFLNIPFETVFANVKPSFNLPSYTSLLLLTKLFKSNKNDRVLFYYINDYKPTSNHYHRWIDDHQWINKIPNDTLKYIKINYQSKENISNRDINFYSLLEKIVEHSRYHFDKPKKKVLLITSDSLIGPNILSCFSLDLFQVKRNLKPNWYNEKLFFQVSFDCYRKLHTRYSKVFDYFSFLYRMPGYSLNHYSGIFIWRVNEYLLKISEGNTNQVKISFDFKETIQEGFKNSNVETSAIVTNSNFYKCTMRDDIFAFNKRRYEDTYCVFGYESFRQNDLKMEDIFFRNGYFYELIRNKLFSSTHVIKYQNLEKPEIPNIVHLVWFGGPQSIFKLIDYLCLKSLIHIVKPEIIKIHGDIEPFGSLWDEIKIHPLIKWIHRERPLYRFGYNFTLSPIQHLADIARLEIMYEEGGIYTDFDILWVKALDHYRFYDVELIASNDITSYCLEFPNSIQIGAFLSPPKSKFIKKWIESYADYHLYPNDYAAISMCEPYKLFEKEPEKVLIDNRLQMIYFNGWQSFIPRYVDIEFEQLKNWQDDLDWLNDGTHGYHLPRNTALHNEFELKRANKSSIHVRIAHFILNLK